MVNAAEYLGIDPTGGHPERALALGYAPAVTAPGVAAVFALDQTLARLTLGTRDPMVAQLRLTWWREALCALENPPVPSQPILQTLAAARADGERLAVAEDGWERLLGPLDQDELMAFAAERSVIFAEAARLAGAADDVEAAGSGWSLADLAQTTADRDLADRAALLAMPLLRQAATQRWSPAGRFLGALVHVAAADLNRRREPGSPSRVVRLAWHRLTGR
ncbi:hypothetical protein [uncultured Sphingomonas sp.]|uniref:hypothetical protein n=1 Tax=uncultured Sphingomonas sp. TaxID=158754 RepID=UPI0011A81CE4|nr:hypothetical protein [uncultured Sphingomonas sp.]